MVTLGIKSTSVSGVAKNGEYDYAKYKIPHAWNIIEIQGERFLIDTVWGTGNGNQNVYYDDEEEAPYIKQLDPSHFMADPNWFVFTRFPDTLSNQLLTKNKTLNWFKTAPSLKCMPMTNNWTLVKPDKCTYDSNAFNTILLHMPEDKQHIIDDINCKSLIDKNKSFHMSVTYYKEFAIIQHIMGLNGKHSIDLFATDYRTMSEEDYYKITSLLAKSEGFDQKYHEHSDYCVRNPSFSEFGGYVYYPKSRYLPEDSVIDFKVYLDLAYNGIHSNGASTENPVINAIMQYPDGKSIEVLEHTGDGIFKGKIAIEKGCQYLCLYDMFTTEQNFNDKSPLV